MKRKSNSLPWKIRSFFFATSADDVDSASKINADEQFIGSAKFFGKYGRHNTCEWIYLKVVLHKRPTSLALYNWFSFKGKGTSGEDPGKWLNGYKRAECISISFSRLLLAKMIITVIFLKQLPLAAIANARAYNRE